MSVLPDSAAGSTTQRASALIRLLAFAVESHPPIIYALVAGSWALSVLTLLQGTRPAATLDWGSAGVALAFFLILLFLRAIDEIKDLDYDRLHNPQRPLVRGLVNSAEVISFAAAIFLAVLLLSASLAPQLLPFAATQMAYGVMLLWLERHWRQVRQNVMLNLLVTFPVSAALNVYVWLYLAARHLAPGWTWSAAVIAAHVGVFLHMEFGRKLKWPQLSEVGENGYAQVLGVPLTVTLCALLGIGGVATACTLQLRSGAGAWAALPAAALLLSAIGLLYFWRVRDRVVALKPLFGGAMIVFFLLNAAVALLR